MSTGTTKTEAERMTAEEFAAWVHRPENTNSWFELVRGEVIELPPPTKPHGVICGNVCYLLGAYIRQRGKGYVTGNDSGVILERDPDTVRGPDVALYEDSEAFADLHPKYGEVPPRLAVEVLSPNDRADRLLRKVTDYLRTGVEIVWVVDPEVRTVTVYRPDNGPRVYHEDDELTGEEVLPELRCKVADFFSIPGTQREQRSKPPRKPRRKQ